MFRRILKELVITLGPTPYMGTEIYSIPLNFCDEHTGTMDYGCGDTCSQLKNKEKMSIFRKFQQIWQTIQGSVKVNSKLFIFLRVSEPLLNFSDIENIEEDDGFEIPDETLIKRRNVLKYEIIVEKCRRLLKLEEDHDDNEIIDEILPSFWLKLTTFMIRQQ
uniref:Uncharacterized protein n=1 Tax=Panagrolaimus sp. JU765 TaxID=591449 RepID=A0AC34R4L9_9BILA